MSSIVVRKRAGYESDGLQVNLGRKFRIAICKARSGKRTGAESGYEDKPSPMLYLAVRSRVESEVRYHRSPNRIDRCSPFSWKRPPE
jgi:hypothetical protein